MTWWQYWPFNKLLKFADDTKLPLRLFMFCLFCVGFVYNICKKKQDTQLSLTNRVTCLEVSQGHHSPNMVPFHMLCMVSYYCQRHWVPDVTRKFPLGRLKPLPSLPFPCLPFPTLPSSLPFPVLPLPLEVGPPIPARGSGAEPQPKSNLVHFSLKIWHLMATILMIFLRISWPNFVQFEQ